MNKNIKVKLPGNLVKDVELGTSIVDVIGGTKDIGAPLLATVNGELKELTETVLIDSEIKYINASSQTGYWAYARSLLFVFIVSVKEVLKGANVTISHSINNEYYGEINYIRDINEEDIQKIKDRMYEIIAIDTKIEKIRMGIDKAEEIFNEYGMKDKLRLLKHAKVHYVSIYKCRGIYDYFYGPLLPSAGYLKLFKVMYYKPGFIILLPGSNKLDEIPPFKEVRKLRSVYEETKRWSDILDVTDVSGLNEKIQSGEIKDIILVSEGLHEKKISRIADSIFENIIQRKLIMIAGPSSSGKTTFSKRLSIQLRVLGLKPYNMSMDDYFIDRDHTPKKKNGDYDFESINAVDLKLFNEHLNLLFKGEEIDIIKYDFLTGKRQNTGKRYKMEENSILLVEGLHGLNEEVTYSIEKKLKYKIYVSALTQLNLDFHNSIYVSHIRMLRRIIRDHRHRGWNAESTILMWPSVREGEERNIFPFQEEADIMFNSTLIYEMSLIKKYAEPLLKEITKESPTYVTATRLLKTLGYFETGDEDIVPKNSIIREFIGGSCFE